MNWLRAFLSFAAGAGAALVAYGIAFTHGNPRPPEGSGDYVLAFQLIPLELLVGVLVGVAVYRAFTRRAALGPREDTAERMVMRLAMRRGGRFTLDDLVSASPLDEAQAQQTVARLVNSGRLREDAQQYVVKTP